MVDHKFGALLVIYYDEFGITDQKTKIVYVDITDTMTASATRMDMLPVV